MPPKTLRLKGWMLAELSARALAEGGAEAGGAGREPDRSQGARGGRFRGDSGGEATRRLAFWPFRWPCGPAGWLGLCRSDFDLWCQFDGFQCPSIGIRDV